jgi:transposase
MSEETRAEIIRLREHYGTRAIAQRVGWSRKLVTRVLAEHDGARPERPPSPQSLLEGFEAEIERRVEAGLTVTRTLREIRAAGYRGGRTILAVHVRKLRAQLPFGQGKKVKRRFETRPAEELQIDWSPYTIWVAGQLIKVHALGCLLAYSRKLFLRLYRDERQSTLLEGLASAFEYFGGVAVQVVLDNMATAVVGRLSAGGIVWNERFLDFARHYGFTPFACRVRHPDRKGKKEKSFRLVWDDFLKSTHFASWDDVHEACRIWLDQTPDVCNQRLHGTTRRVPNEAFLEERDLLIALPQERFGVFEQSVRTVDEDSTLSIRGTRYTVPSMLANRSVPVRLYAEHFEVVDPHGRIAFSRRYAKDEERGRLLIDPTHYALLPQRPRDDRGAARLDEAFLKRFPSLAPLCDGLKLRFKGLAPIHLRALLRLVDRFGEPAFLAAARRAQEYRRFDATAVKRILERDHALPDDDETPRPLGGLGPTLLGEVEVPALDGYAALDTVPLGTTVPGTTVTGTTATETTATETTATETTATETTATETTATETTATGTTATGTDGIDEEGSHGA